MLKALATRSIAVIAVQILIAHSAEAQPVVRLDPEFTSSLSVKQVENIAMEMLSRPVAALETKSDGETTIIPAPPVVREIVGCRGADVAQVDPDLSPMDHFPWVWVVKARGTYSIASVGTFQDAEGIMIIHPESGVVFEWGVSPNHPSRE